MPTRQKQTNSKLPRLPVLLVLPALKKLPILHLLHLLPLLLLILISFATYSNIFPNQLVWDDPGFVTDWKATQQFPSTWKDLLTGSVPEGHDGVLRPIRNLHYGIAYWLWGQDLWWYHLQSIVIHSTATVLVYWLVRQLLNSVIPESESAEDIRDPKTSEKFKNQLTNQPINQLTSQNLFANSHLLTAKYIPFLTALLFAVHPIHVEAITWITSSFDIVGIVWDLLSLNLFILARRLVHRSFSEVGSSSKDGYPSKSLSTITIPLYLLSWLFLLLANFSNEMTLTTGGLFVAYDFFLTNRISTIKKFIKKIPEYFVWSIPVLANLYIRINLMQIEAREDYILGTPLVTAQVMIVAFVKYLKLIIWPFPLTVNHSLLEDYTGLYYHDTNILDIPPAPSWFNPTLLISLIIILGIVYWLWQNYKHYPLIAFLFVFHTLALLPALQIVPQSILFSERYAYFASVGSISLVVLILYQMLHKLKVSSPNIFLGIFVILVSAIFGYLTYQRNFDWQNNRTLWQKTLDIGPPSPYALNNLAKTYFDADDKDMAIKLFRQAQAINPNHSIAMSNLGFALTSIGKYDEAIALHLHIDQIFPNYTPNYEKLAAAYFRNNQFDKAIEWYGKYRDSKPDSVDAQIKLATAFHGAYIYNQAIEQYQKAIEMDPQNWIAYHQLAIVYYEIAELDLAQENLDKAKAINPENPEIDKYLKLVEEERQRRVEDSDL